jgi:hypothetical protein
MRMDRHTRGCPVAHISDSIATTGCRIGPVVSHKVTQRGLKNSYKRCYK